MKATWGYSSMVGCLTRMVKTLGTHRDTKNFSVFSNEAFYLGRYFIN